MRNPWEDIELSDYEGHMSSQTVMQEQCLNEMMKGQVCRHPVKTVMVLGVAGGNGLEHIDPRRIERVYGVDVNEEYLAECAHRYACLGDVLKCLHADLTDEGITLPHADLVVADLLVEYIGCECFARVVKAVGPSYVSAIIQVNTDAGFVSGSPYQHVFDRLDSVHHQIDEDALSCTMTDIGYMPDAKEERLLPNGKKLVRLDYGC